MSAKILAISFEFGLPRATERHGSYGTLVEQRRVSKVNHYADGAAVKRPHRDGWGRQRGVNITVGASFGGARTLRFEAVGRDTAPQRLDCLQQDLVWLWGCGASDLHCWYMYVEWG